jgi:Tfp pilus assembly protein PilO
MPSGRALRLGLVALTSAALTLAFDWLALRPSELDGLARTEARLEAQKRDIRALELTANKLEEFKLADASLHESLTLVEQIRPPEPRLEPLEGRLRAVATGYGLALVEWKPHAGDDTARVDLRLLGPYAGLVSFLERLPRLARLIRVERIEMERREGPQFELQLRISAFYHKD